jgi:putative SOS response-associated peptidase YedK
MCNLYSMTKGQAAIRNLFKVTRDSVGNQPLMPGIFPDYPALIVRNADVVRELTMARWGMPSSSQALFEAAKRRAAKLEAKGTRSTLRRCCGWSPIAAPPTSEILRAKIGSAGWA